MNDVIVTSIRNLQNEVNYGGHTLIVDEPKAVGGDEAGPDPYTLILGALGSCISMTVTMYARRKEWPLEKVTVRLRTQRLHAKDCLECTKSTDGFVHRIYRSVKIEGDLDETQQARLQEIAHKCPVHRMLSSEIIIAELPRDS